MNGEQAAYHMGAQVLHFQFLLNAIVDVLMVLCECVVLPQYVSLYWCLSHYAILLQ